jgi:hypothetical protein
MKYFTPERLVRFCSPDDDRADHAGEEWEQAADRYRRHYRTIAPALPATLRKFHDELCLHDADVFAPAKVAKPTLPKADHEVVIVTQNINTLVPEFVNTLIFLHYGVTEEPSIVPHTVSSALHQVQPRWLYDEIDLVEPGLFAHEMLLSTGRVITLRFRAFRGTVAPLVGRIQDTGVKGRAKGKAASA